MTKADIVKKIHTTIGLSQKDAAEMMEAVCFQFSLVDCDVLAENSI